MDETMNIDWTRISKFPTSPKVMRHLLQDLRQKKSGKDFDYTTFLKGFVSSKSVLDIGVVEHDLEHAFADTWKHKDICSWARSTVGVDILGEEIKALSAKGYNVIHADATSDVDLGVRCERVTILDVIEHVDNPVGLLKFAGRHLESGGKVLVATPNPYWYKFIWRNIREGTFVANAEHISWITPSMALELARRSGLELETYWLATPYGRNFFMKTLRKTLEMFLGDTELFAWAFFYIYKKSNGNMPCA